MAAHERPFWALLVGPLCLLGAANLVASFPRADATLSASVPDAAEQQPTIEHRYKLAARVRPLLFWIGKDNVGEARLKWLSGPGSGRGYEMLIGSDPRKAPRGVNRWGYIREMDGGAGVQVFGLMTEADEDSIEQAKSTTGGVAAGTRVFKIIRSTIENGSSTSVVQGVPLSDQLTLHDLDVVIGKIPEPRSAKSVGVPPGTQPGFLFAMAALMNENVTAVDRGRAPSNSTRRSYIYANKMYEVVTRSSRLLKRTTINGRDFANVIESEFESRRINSSSGETYWIVYGTAGSLREIPIRVVYRPKWWFEAEIVLSDGTR